VRNEARLARAEATALLRGLGIGSAAVAVGGVLALLGGLCLLAGVILLAGDQWLHDDYWLAALIVTLIAGGAAAFYAWRGMQRLSPAQLVPNQTVATLKEDVEWLRRQRT
jgi:drug/metabolite transporter (DMT)-like permease